MAQQPTVGTNPVLETERLRLRPLTLADEAALLAVFEDPDARRFYPQMKDAEQVRGWIEWNLDSYAQHGFGLWGLERKGNPTLIGDCGLTYQDVEGRSELEIGWHVLASERGRRYATEAAIACRDYAFETTRHARVVSIVRPANRASRRVAERVHSKCRAFEKRGAPADLFSTTREAWQAGAPVLG